MTLKSDLEAEVRKIISDDPWTIRDGQQIPDTEDVQLRNDAVKIAAVVLYADISESTKLVDNYKAKFAAEVYKSFLRCCARIIRAEGGSITAFDGDRIMGVYYGEHLNSRAARTGLKINYACKKIIQPAINAEYPNTNYVLQHTVGIDRSELFIVRGGIRDYNDLVWLGRAGNYAAKLCTLSHDYPTRISKDVYERINANLKTTSDGGSIWESRVWTKMNNFPIYRSNFTWKVS